MRNRAFAFRSQVLFVRFIALLGFAAPVLSLAPASRAQEFICPVSESGPVSFEPIGM